MCKSLLKNGTARLYDDSLTGWVQDKNNPMAFTAESEIVKSTCLACQLGMKLLAANIDNPLSRVDVMYKISTHTTIVI